MPYRNGKIVNWKVKVKGIKALLSDKTFDELEKLYCKLFDCETAPRRAMERDVCYTQGVKFIYELIKEKKNEKIST